MSLASISNWADSVVLLHPETFNLHFVNIPYGSAAYDATRDCQPSPRGDCIVNAVERYRATLADKTQSPRNRAEALKFLVHLVGDLHQPLHCATRDDDVGGTMFFVTFFGISMSLHQVWDVALIEHHGYDWGSQVGESEAWLAAHSSPNIIQGSPSEWASETHRIAVDVAYDLPEDHRLADEYYHKALPAAQTRLAIAGIRLAHVLNEALDPAFQE